MSIPTTEAILADLVAFPTLSCSPNGALVDYVRGLLAPTGAVVEVVAGHGAEDGSRSNLWVTVGPADKPGIVLSGHSDVVPVAGQAWSRDPFCLSEAEGRLYGRGTADMKGFLAAALRCALLAARRPLATPLHLAISCDEEVGCVGVRSLLGWLAQRPTRPQLVWIGEPTEMALASGHKGKRVWRATCHGRAAHSALAPSGLNAIHLAADFVVGLRAIQADLAAQGLADAAYAVPWSTLHVGTISGGEALNIVAPTCVVDYELRDVAGEDVAAITARIAALAQAITAPHLAAFPEAAITIEERNAYPGLASASAPALAFMRALSGSNGPPVKLAFGTEGGLFAGELGVPAVICGPGSMDQGHKPDEYVTRSQLALCDAMLARLVDRLEAGVSLG